MAKRRPKFKIATPLPSPETPTGPASEADAARFVRDAPTSGRLELRYVEPEAILARPNPDLFSVGAPHVLKIAQSLPITDGLINAVYVDTTGHLVDGGHRIRAVQLIRTAPADRPPLLARWSEKGITGITEALIKRAVELPHLPDLLLPTRYGDFDAADDPTRARLAEVAANALHDRRARQFRRALELVQNDDAFWMGRGRPKKGTQSGRLFLATAFGVDESTVREWIAEVNGTTRRRRTKTTAIERVIASAQKKRDSTRHLAGLSRQTAEALGAQDLTDEQRNSLNSWLNTLDQITARS